MENNCFKLLQTTSILGHIKKIDNSHGLDMLFNMEDIQMYKTCESKIKCSIYLSIKDSVAETYIPSKLREDYDVNEQVGMIITCSF